MSRGGEKQRQRRQRHMELQILSGVEALATLFRDNSCNLYWHLILMATVGVKSCVHFNHTFLVVQQSQTDTLTIRLFKLL